MFDRVVSCAADACPAAILGGEPLLAGLRGVYCDVHVAPEVGADTPCDDPRISGVIDAALLGAAAPLRGLCTDGLRVEPEVCEGGCQALVPCAEANGSLDLWRIDESLCRLTCFAGPPGTPGPGLWRCMAALAAGGECVDVFACLGE